MRIEFLADLETGNAQIDRQHRELVDWCNALNDPDSAAVRGGRLSAALRFVIGYVDLHFAVEERVMAAAGYPGMEAHLKGHAYFRRAVAQLRRDLGSVDSARTAALQLHHLILDWFLQHIRLTDRSLADWLRQHAPELVVEEPGAALDELLRASGISAADLDGMRVVKPAEPPRRRRRVL
ncbi:MAG: bacteriohemerythrin [Pseudomonadota bacterium]